MQAVRVVAGTDGVKFSDIECFRCHHLEHYTNKCPQASGTQAMHFVDLGAVAFDSDSNDDDDSNPYPHFMFAQRLSGTIGDAEMVSHNHILLYNVSSCSVFKNKRLLRNIHHDSAGIRAYTNGAHQDSHLHGIFQKFFEIWYNPKSILNILSYF